MLRPIYVLVPSVILLVVILVAFNWLNERTRTLQKLNNLDQTVYQCVNDVLKRDVRCIPDPRLFKKPY